MATKPISKSTPKQIIDTRAVVTSDRHIDDTIGVSFSHPTKQFKLRTRVRVRLGDWESELQGCFMWNGADIPRLLWSIVGIAPCDRRALLATAVHDKECEDKRIGQAMADALFVSLLMPHSFNGRPMPGVGRRRAIIMYAGVRLWSGWKWLKGLVR